MAPTGNDGNSGAGSSTGQPKFKIEPPYYPIVYVRGYAMRSTDREEVFNDAYYGFAITSVEKREASPQRKYFTADLFEGMMIRLMKDHNYCDSSNAGLKSTRENPSRSLWVSRFYDADYFIGASRDMLAHAQDLDNLIHEEIPARLRDLEVDTTGYKVILIAHSMGGLICRTLIQKVLPTAGRDPKDTIHRLVTLGTPHRGIDLGAIPDFLENPVASMLNPFDAGMFKEARLRRYLNLEQPASAPDKDERAYLYDVHSLGPRTVDDPGAKSAFPIKRCLCIIGSDWNAYDVGGTVVRRLTGGVSDGLVKQDRAYLVAGPPPEKGGSSAYDEAHRAFWANVHRAHSGNRGIVNSYESYENIQRFLFGDTIVRLELTDIELRTLREEGTKYLYDFEFLLSVRGTSSYLHRRQQDPCENAIRVELEGDASQGLPSKLFLHTGFMNSKLQEAGDPWSHFALTFQVVERRLRRGLLWDRDYPARVIYVETMEARIGAAGNVEYQWLSELDAQADRRWKKAKAGDDGAYSFPLRKAQSFGATLLVHVGAWPDPTLTLDS